MINDHPQEVYYDEYTGQTERLSVGAILASAADQPPIARDYTSYVIGALLVAAGWYARGLFAIPYDYQLLAWLVPLATFLIAWGNRRSA